MIDIGSIAYGPELERRPVMRGLESLSQVLRLDPEPTAWVELAYVVPGTMGRAEFEGFKVDRRRGAHKNLIVYIDVPTVVAESESPLPALIDLARMAIRFVRGGLGPSPGMIDQAEAAKLQAELESAADKLGVSARAGDVSPPRPPAGMRMDGVPAGVHVLLSLRDRQDMLDAFELEAAIEQHLAAAGTGYVDGNEVGDDQFTIFAYGPDGAKLSELVTSTIRGRWNRRGALLQLYDGDRDVVTVRIN